MTAPRRIVLVGFMGSGKSTVGPRVAEALEWIFLDVDHEVEARNGASVAELFERKGQAWFRGAEAEVAREFLERDGVVVATGGGWGAADGRLDTVPPGTVSVWLKVSPEVAVRRARSQPGQRPLLAVDDPLEAARALLLRREARYARADHTVDTTDRSPDDVTRRIVEAIRSS
ncbi:MAG: shikimate kinase [Longimicrobiales bacterium]